MAFLALKKTNNWAKNIHPLQQVQREHLSGLWQVFV